MAYPFVPHVTWAEFLSKLATLGATVQASSSGTPYLERADNGHVYWTPIPTYGSANECVPPSVLRSICAGLKIDPGPPFGYTLG